MTEPLLYTVAEAAELLKCKRTKIYELLRTGVLRRGMQHGKLTTILAESVRDAAIPEDAPIPRKRVRKRKDFDAELGAWAAEMRGQ